MCFQHYLESLPMTLPSMSILDPLGSLWYLFFAGFAPRKEANLVSVITSCALQDAVPLVADAGGTPT